MSRTNAVTEYFARELRKLGYEPNDKVETYTILGGKGKPSRQGSHTRPTVWWGLSYCQGDGMAFDARLNTDLLLGRLMKGSRRAAARRAIEKAISYMKVVHSGRYTHWNSMDVDYEGYTDDCTPLEQSAFEEFIGVVDEDVKATSRRLEREGYAYLEGTRPSWFAKGDHEHESDGRTNVILRRVEIGRFAVEFKLLEDPYFCPYEDWDEEAEPGSTVTDIIEGRTVAYGAEVVVKDRENGNVLGRAALHGITDDKDLGYFHKEIKRDLLGEAVHDARETIGRYSGVRAA